MIKEKERFYQDFYSYAFPFQKTWNYGGKERKTRRSLTEIDESTLERNLGISPSILVDRQGKIRRVNQLALDLFGHSQKEMCGEPIGSYINESLIGVREYNFHPQKIASYLFRKRTDNLVAVTSQKILTVDIEVDSSELHREGTYRVSIREGNPFKLPLFPKPPEEGKGSSPKAFSPRRTSPTHVAALPTNRASKLRKQYIEKLKLFVDNATTDEDTELNKRISSARRASMAGTTSFFPKLS